MKTIIFDVDDTLYDQMIPFEQAIQKNFPKEITPIAELYAAMRVFSDKVFHLTEGGEMGLEEMHIYRIQKAYETFEKTITDEQALSFQKDYAQNQKEITLLPEVKEVLDLCLEKGIKMGIITNGPTNHQKNKIKQLGMEKWIPKENMFISGEVGIAKPNVELFKHVEQSMNLDSDETYYFGDSFENDMVGASNAGWKKIWKNHRNKEVLDESVEIEFVVDGENSLIEVVEGILEN